MPACRLTALGAAVACVAARWSRLRPTPPSRGVVVGAIDEGVTEGPTLQKARGKQVWFVRHGQAEHNILYEAGKPEECKALLDPELTTRGRQQASAMAEDPLLEPWLTRPPEEGGVELAVVSPLRRTVETGLRALRGWAGKAPGRRLLLHADLQETGEVRCDTGSPLPTLRERFAEDTALLDFDMLWDGWDEKVGPYSDNGPAVGARLGRFRDWLAARPESRVVVVGHHNVLVALLGVTFMNCEVRQYALTPEGAWEAVAPRISRSDDELSAAELRHLKVYIPMVRRKFAGWGIDAPERWR